MGAPFFFECSGGNKSVESVPSAPPGVKYNICCVARFTSGAFAIAGRKGKDARGGGRGSVGGVAAGGVAATGQMQSINGSAWWYTPDDDEWQPHGAFPFAAATHWPPSEFENRVARILEKVLVDPRLRTEIAQLAVATFGGKKCTSLTNQSTALKTYFDNWAVRQSNWQRALFTPLDKTYICIYTNIYIFRSRI